MSKQANPLTIGAFIVGAVVLLVVGIIVIGGGKWFSETERFVVYFDESINGLTIGAPVKLSGVQIGQVVDINVVRDGKLNQILVPVVFEIEPDKIIKRDNAMDDMDTEEILDELIKEGLRLQLQMTSMLTGRLFIEARFLPDSPVKLLDHKEDLPEVPSVPSSVQAIQDTINKLLNDFQKIPLEQLFNEILQTVSSVNELVSSEKTRNTMTALSETVFDLQRIVARLRDDSGQLTGDLQQTLERTSRLMQTLNTHAGPILSNTQEAINNANATLLKVQSALDTMQTAGQQVTPMSRNFNAALSELGKAARSIRVLADYLERHPEALFQGKSNLPGE